MLSKILRALGVSKGPDLRPGHRAPRTWTDFQRIRMSGREPGYKRLDKIDVAALAASINVRVPERYRTFETVSDVAFDGHPDQFVLKPDASHSRAGVMLLRRRPDGLYTDALRKRTLSTKQILDELRAVSEAVRRRSPDRPPLKFLTEELLIPDDGSERVPLDYKAFTFGGEVRFILQVDRNTSPTEIAFFKNEFEVSGEPPAVSSYDTARQGLPIVPVHAEGILDIARRVTLHMKTPFASIDCYSTSRGAMLGEITQTPGGPYYGDMYRFTAEYEALLGAAYRHAYEQLGMQPRQVRLEYLIRKGGREARIVGADGLSMDGLQTARARKQRERA